MKKIPILLLLLAPLVSGIARAQSFDLGTGRIPVASLDGLWRFHTGDNLAWADPKFDDSQWPLLRSGENWSTQGYTDYSGMAWYRFQVVVPVGLDHLSLYLPEMRTCYEVYADGKLIGTYGTMRPVPKVQRGGGPFQVFTLPAGIHADGKIAIALRVWEWPTWAMYRLGGPQHGGGLVGESQQINERSTLDRADLHWRLTSYQTLAFLQMLAGLGTLALFALRRKEREYLWFSLMMLLSAASGWIYVSVSTQVWDVETHDVLDHLVLTGASLAYLAFLQALLRPGRTRLLKLAVAFTAASPFLVLICRLEVWNLSVWLQNVLGFLLELPFYAWVIRVVLVRARQNSIDARLLVAPVILSASASLFEQSAWIAYNAGWQRKIGQNFEITQNPFPIDLVHVTNALFLLAVFAILILRFTRTRSAEERFAGEVQAARNVQQYLIPEHLPSTPGLCVESEYRPAKEVGGDFFQVLPDAADGSVLIVVGDVAGHGMEAGMLATLIVGAIRTAASFTTDPARILSLLNDRMQGRGLATCLALRIERDGSATLANAGHLPPYLNGNELAIEGALPLGAIPGIDFPVLQFKLAADDTLMLMTDGVAEAQDAQGHLFGFDRISEMLRKGIPAAALATAAQAFGQEDDITVLTVRSVTA